MPAARPFPFQGEVALAANAASILAAVSSKLVGLATNPMIDCGLGLGLGLGLGFGLGSMW